MLSRSIAIALLAGFFLTPFMSFSQTLSTASSRWSDSFVEWELYTLVPVDSTDLDAKPEEEQTGEIKQRWLATREDWSEWDYKLGDEQGTIKVKWKDNPNEWELRSYSGNVITMRTSWNNDKTEWRVTDNNISLNLKSRWKNQLDEWLVEDANRGKFYLYTLRSRDPRDWAIEDNLDASVSQSMKIALVFLTIFNSSPRM